MEHQINITNHNWLQKKKSGESLQVYVLLQTSNSR